MDYRLLFALCAMACVAFLGPLLSDENNSHSEDDGYVRSDDYTATNVPAPATNRGIGTLADALRKRSDDELGKYAIICADQLDALDVRERQTRETLMKAFGTDSMTGRTYLSAIDDAAEQVTENCKQVLDMMDWLPTDGTKSKMKSLIDANYGVLDSLSDIARFGDERQYRQVKENSDAISARIKELGDRIEKYD